VVQLANELPAHLRSALASLIKTTSANTLSYEQLMRSIGQAVERYLISRNNKFVAIDQAWDFAFGRARAAEAEDLERANAAQTLRRAGNRARRADKRPPRVPMDLSAPAYGARESVRRARGLSSQKLEELQLIKELAQILSHHGLPVSRNKGSFLIDLLNHVIGPFESKHDTIQRLIRKTVGDSPPISVEEAIALYSRDTP
jgi:hypothetical protein